MKTLVCFGSSTMTDYAFLAPLTALMWRDVIGHTPRVFLVGTKSEWVSLGRTRAAVEALEHHRIEHQFVDRFQALKDRPEVYQDSTVAQNIRQHASSDPSIPDEQWVMMSDADLWPLRREFYHQHEGAAERAVLLYSNGDHFQGKDETLAKIDADAGIDWQSIPTCHVTMRACEWRDLYHPVTGDILESTRNTLDKYLLPTMKKFPARAGWEMWMSDQRIVTERLCRQSWFPSEIRFVERRGHSPVDRLDRGCPHDWYSDHFDKDRWTDAHMHKGSHSDEKWADIRPILSALLPQHLEWAEGYRNEYARTE